MNPKGRIIVAALSLSAIGFIGLIGSEGYAPTAMIPTRGDVPTLGFGSTTREDGTPVRLGDTTTPPKALRRTLAYIQDDEADMRKTLEGVALHQAEYDTYVDFRYQYGAGAWRKSAMLQHLRDGEYAEACVALLEYKYVDRYDCSTPGNRRCMGVWTRQLKRHAACMDAQ